MKSKFRKALAAGSGALAILALAAPAHAAPPPGSNGRVDHVRWGGSDTTYEMMQKLDLLFNASVGCSLILALPPAPEPATEGYGTKCATPLTGVDTENFDHDTSVQEYPIGSGNGRTKLRVEPDSSDLVAARSSDARATGNARENGLSMSSFAKDGLAVVVFFGPNGANPGFPSNPTVLSLTIGQVEQIFSGAGSPAGCGPAPGTGKTWSQLVPPVAIPGDPQIRPYGVQTGSGTYKSFDSLITGDPNACANHIGGGRVFFENNMAPFDGGTGTDGTVYPTPAADRAGAITWMSNGPRLVDATATKTAKPFNIINSFGNSRPPDLGNITLPVTDPNHYAFNRFLWQANRKIDVSYSAPLGSVAGTLATVAPRGVNGNAGYTGSIGAAHIQRAWLCRNGGHAAAPKAYNTEITAAINTSGFARISVAESNINPVTGVQERCKLDNFVASGVADPNIIPLDWKTA